MTPFLSQIVAALRRERPRGHGRAREDLSRSRRAHARRRMTLDEILRLIRGAGKTPAERDSFYNVLRTFDEPEAPTRREAA